LLALPLFSFAEVLLTLCCRPQPPASSCALSPVFPTAFLTLELSSPLYFAAVAHAPSVLSPPTWSSQDLAPWFDRRFGGRLNDEQSRDVLRDCVILLSPSTSQFPS
jgi:hypothetical protein